MQQQTHHPPGPLTTTKAFRRPTGAHAILVSLALADLLGVLIWLFAGALLTPPIWWILQGIIPLLHASLLLDIGIVLILACVAIGLLRQHVQKKSADEAWGCAGPLVVLLITALLLIALLKISWMTISSPVPAITPQPIHGWPLHLSIIGGEVAAGLAVLAHFILFRRAPRDSGQAALAFARPPRWDAVWTARASLWVLSARLGPLRHLKTPPTFFFFPRSPQVEADAQAHSEREMYWDSGELVICQAYLSPEKEQAEVLLPLVARLLHDYNSPVALVERLFRLAHLAEDSL